MTDINVLVTSASGPIAYSLLPQIANGNLFNSKQMINLTLYDSYENSDSLNGVSLELTDCCFQNLKDIQSVCSRNKRLYINLYDIIILTCPNINLTLDNSIVYYYTLCRELQSHPDINTKIIIVGRYSYVGAFLLVILTDVDRENIFVVYDEDFIDKTMQTEILINLTKLIKKASVEERQSNDKHEHPLKLTHMTCEQFQPYWCNQKHSTNHKMGVYTESNNGLTEGYFYYQHVMVSDRQYYKKQHHYNYNDLQILSTITKQCTYSLKYCQHQTDFQSCLNINSSMLARL